MADFSNSRFFNSSIELKGVFPSPFIESVSNGNIGLSTTQDVTITGLNFTPDSMVEISETSIIVNSVTYVSPVTIIASVTSSTIQGTFDLVVKNNSLESGNTGAGAIRVLQSIWVDLRTEPIANLGLEVTTGVIVNQDPAKGLWASGTGGTWNRGVKFTAHQWNRADNVEFSFVFTLDGTGLFMFGIGEDNIDVNALANQSYFRGEIKIFVANLLTNNYWGGGVQANWTQNTPSTINYVANAIPTINFYKVKFQNSGADGSLITIHQVDPSNFDIELSTLSQLTSNNPATDPLLMPFWAAVSSPNVFMTAFKIF